MVLEQFHHRRADTTAGHADYGQGAHQKLGEQQTCQSLGLVGRLWPYGILCAVQAHAT